MPLTSFCLLTLVFQAEDMVGEIKWAFEESLKYVGWMDSETKKAAKEKVGERLIGFLSAGFSRHYHLI